MAADPFDPFAADSLEHDQERAVGALRESYAAGACTLDELTKRTAAVYAARSSSEVEDAVGRFAAAPAVVAGASLEPHLVGGERVLWTGRPDPSRRFERSDLYTVPFGLLWGGFAIFWETSVIAGGAPLFFVLWGIPFVAIGLYLFAGRFVYKAWLRRRTLYAVTDRRLLRVIRRRSGESVDALFLDAVPAVHRELRGDGSGSLAFGSSSARGLPTSIVGMRSPNEDAPVLTFVEIPDAARVADLVAELRRSRRPS